VGILKKRTGETVRGASELVKHKGEWGRVEKKGLKLPLKYLDQPGRRRREGTGKTEESTLPKKDNNGWNNQRGVNANEENGAGASQGEKKWFMRGTGGGRVSYVKLRRKGTRTEGRRGVSNRERHLTGVRGMVGQNLSVTAKNGRRGRLRRLEGTGP